MKRHFFLLAGVVLVGAAAATACANRDSGSESTDQDLTSTIAEARACAVRAAYIAADLGAFGDVAAADLPKSLRDNLHPSATVAQFSVPNLGTVYVAELVEAESAVTSFYSTQGTLLVTARNGGARWLDARSKALSCSGSSAKDAGGSSSGGHDGGGGGGGGDEDGGGVDNHGDVDAN